MLDLAKHIVDLKKAEWKPERFEDQYEDALKELLKKKAVWSEDRSAARTRALEGHQSLGRATSLRGDGTRWWRTPQASGAGDHRAPKKAGRSSARAKKRASSLPLPIERSQVGMNA